MPGAASGDPARAMPALRTSLLLLALSGLSACTASPPLRHAASVPSPGAECPAPGEAVAGAERLTALRAQIDCVDAALARLTGARLAVARDVGVTKRALGRPVVDTTREAAVTARFVALAAAQGVPPETAIDPHSDADPRRPRAAMTPASGVG